MDSQRNRRFGPTHHRIKAVVHDLANNKEGARKPRSWFPPVQVPIATPRRRNSASI